MPPDERFSNEHKVSFAALLFCVSMAVFILFVFLSFSFSVATLFIECVQF